MLRGPGAPTAFPMAAAAAGLTSSTGARVAWQVFRPSADEGYWPALQGPVTWTVRAPGPSRRRGEARSGSQRDPSEPWRTLVLGGPGRHPASVERPSRVAQLLIPVGRAPFGGQSRTGSTPARWCRRTGGTVRGRWVRRRVPSPEVANHLALTVENIQHRPRAHRGGLPERSTAVPGCSRLYACFFRPM
jgi:hypothetical protein